MEDRLPRELVAILYADVVGYSRLSGEDEDATHRALSEYLDLISSTIESQDGQVMHYAGDAVLAKFDTVVDAMSAAVNIQEGLKARNNDLPDERRVQFRIGINSGDVIEDRGDIYGDGVNVAARLEALADPGGICISDAVRSAVGRKLKLNYQDMGEQQVKNIEEPVRAYKVDLSIGQEPKATTPKESTRDLPEKPSIVVLPFKNMSGDPEQEYFVDGITEEIITGLGNFREIIVIARGSSFLFKDQSVDAVEAANKLDVKYVLEGSVRKSGTRVRIATQLIDGKAGHQLWSERYDRALEDIFAVQDDVSQKIVTRLADRLEKVSLEHALRKKATNLTAYDYWLRGKHYLADWYGSKDDTFRAREMFELAIEIDSEYAAAYAGLAAVCIMELEKRWTTTQKKQEHVA